LFVASYIIIYFAADLFLDNIKELCFIYNLSPFIIGMLILGIDPEESIASIMAAINGLPYISFGNIVGNSIIAMTLPIALTLIFYNLKFKSISKFYFVVIYILLVNLLCSFLFTSGMHISGFIAFGIYLFYILRNLKHRKQEIIEDLSGFDGDIKYYLIIKKIVLAAIGLIFIIIGGEILILSTEQILNTLQIPEAFFGFIIIAFVTNVEELTLIIKAIKRRVAEIGFGAMIGKLIWNLSISFGISAIIIKNLSYLSILFWNWLILLFLILFLDFSISKEEFIKRDGLVLFGFFIIFLTINFLFITH
jgi:cation:H+ antiporter